MLKATVQKVSRNQSDPQIDLEVVYSDEETGFYRTNVFTFPADEDLNSEKVENQIRVVGDQLKAGLADTIQKETDISQEFQGKEFTF